MPLFLQIFSCFKLLENKPRKLTFLCENEGYDKYIIIQKLHRCPHTNLPCKQEVWRKHCCGGINYVSASSYPDQVHFFTILHEIPEFGPHFLPHTTKVSQDTQLLEGLINLEIT